jgi:hypothetical protein
VTSIAQWCKDRNISEVEALMPDMAGVARGKIMPAKKYCQDEGMRLPEALILQTITGDYPTDHSAVHPADIDMVLKGDPNTIRIVPWAKEPTAQVIHDCFYANGNPVDTSPRYVLRKVLNLYSEKGWQPVVAPELEFYLVKPNTDPDYPLEPPIGRSGRAESGRQSYSIDALTEYDPLIEDVYSFCESQNIELDTLIHESGAAQMEINLHHGDALELADQAFLFKRTVREVALRHKMYATFMAKPMEQEPGNAMHVHQSVLDKKTGRNVFAGKDGKLSKLFLSHIAGLQTYLPQRQFLPAHYPFPGRAHQRAVGLRQPYRRAARAGGGPGKYAGGKSRCRGRREPVSGHRRLPCLRLPRNDPEARTHRTGGGERLRDALFIAAGAGRIIATAQRQRAAGGDLRQALRHRLQRGEGNRVHELPSGDQLLGARVFVAERLTTRVGAAIA